MHTPTHRHTYTYSSTLMHTHTDTHRHTHTYTQTHRFRHTYSHTFTHIFTHGHTHIHILPPPYTYTMLRALMNEHPWWSPPHCLGEGDAVTAQSFTCCSSLKPSQCTLGSAPWWYWFGVKEAQKVLDKEAEVIQIMNKKQKGVEPGPLQSRYRWD